MPSLRRGLDRQKLRVNRHARKAVREYYGLPNATAAVANRLIDWKNGDMVGTLRKREEWRRAVWMRWDVAKAQREYEEHYQRLFTGMTGAPSASKRKITTNPLLAMAYGTGFHKFMMGGRRHEPHA